MSKKLFVGNMSWNTQQEDLQNLFEQYGEVEEATIVNDRETGRSRGFGFITFVNDEDAQNAINELDGKEFDGRNIAVNEAKPSKPRRY